MNICVKEFCVSEYMLSFGENDARLSNGPPEMSMSCDYVTLYGKMCFADGVKLRILRWGD